MSIIKVEDIAHVRFTAPDLAEMQSFLEDFGLTAVSSDDSLFMRGQGAAPFIHVTSKGKAGFAALGLRASSKADLETLASSEGAEVGPLDAPGGGFVVRLKDPDGRVVEVVAEQKAVEIVPPPPTDLINSVVDHPRQSQTVRLVEGPAKVVRLGHCALAVVDLAANIKWYADLFGFIISDDVELEPGFSIGAFLRCDRGSVPTDHHTLFLVQAAEEPAYNHAAFEVTSFDDLMLGHNHLAAAERTKEWGVGRHVLGSQIFDYWRDPWGHTVEHWTDGDLFTAEDGSRKATVEELARAQWGPALPPTFG